MADFGLFVGFGLPVRGRERQAADVFGEAFGYYQGLVESGDIESVEPFFLEPHGGDLGGFFLIRGDRDKIARVRASDEFERLSARAQLIVENFGVVGVETGERIQHQMGVFMENVAALT
jgi:hypothetical protein